MASLQRPLLFAAAVISGGAGCSDPGSSGDATSGDGTEESGDESGELGDPCEPGENPTLAIGHGAASYEVLEDGGQIELIHGPQGGYHTLMAVHAERIDASEELLGKFEGYLGGELAGTSSPYLDLRCNGAEGGLQLWSLILIWERTPEDLHLQPVTIEAEIVDAAGTKVTATKEAIIHDATLD